MGLPFFSEIGKEVKDLFEKNFFFDCVNLELKNGSTGSLSYTGHQKYNIKDGKMAGEVEAKYEMDGITFLPKMNTESSIVTYEARVSRPEFKGVNLIINGSLGPGGASKNLGLGANYSTSDYVIELGNFSNDPNVKTTAGALRASIVGNMFGWIMGACGMVDPSGFKIMNANLVGGYKDGRTSFFMNCDPAQKALTGSIFNQVNAGIQVGLTYSLGSSGGGGGSGPLLAFCGSYVLNDGATLKARFNGDYQMGVAYTLKLKPGILVTMCTEIDIQKLKAGGNKMGFGVEFS